MQTANSKRRRSDDGWALLLRRRKSFFFSSRRRHTRSTRDWSSDVCSSDLLPRHLAERALSDAASALRRGGEKTAALVGGEATNEEGFLIQRLMREALGSPHIDSRSNGLLDPEQARALARPDFAAKVPDIDYAESILVLDTSLVDEAPILDLRVRKAVRRNHAKLVVATSRPGTLDPNAHAVLRFAPGATEAALGGLAAALAGGPEADLDDLARRSGTST